MKEISINDIEFKAEYIVDQRVMFDNVSALYLFWKRLFDIIVGSLAIILLSPIFLAIAIIIKIDSPGPVFF